MREVRDQRAEEQFPTSQSSPGRNPLVTIRSTVLPPPRPSMRNSYATNLPSSALPLL
jgi:hypothetical protein